MVPKKGRGTEGDRPQPPRGRSAQGRNDAAEGDEQNPQSKLQIGAPASSEPGSEEGDQPCAASVGKGRERTGATESDARSEPLTDFEIGTAAPPKSVRPKQCLRAATAAVLRPCAIAGAILLLPPKPRPLEVAGASPGRGDDLLLHHSAPRPDCLQLCDLACCRPPPVRRLLFMADGPGYGCGPGDICCTLFGCRRRRCHMDSNRCCCICGHRLGPLTDWPHGRKLLCRTAGGALCSAMALWIAYRAQIQCWIGGR